MELFDHARNAGIVCDSISVDEDQEHVRYTVIRGEIKCEVPVLRTIAADMGIDRVLVEARPLIDTAIEMRLCEREIGHPPNGREYRAWKAKETT